MQKLLSALFITLCLSACGGGGGSSDSPSIPDAGITPPSSPALTFNPSTIAQTLKEGESETINLTATVNHPSDFNGASIVYTYFIDDKGVLLPNAQFIRNSATNYSIILSTSATLAAGSYRDNITVKLCRDSNCNSQFAGSPMLLPYALQVTPTTAPFYALAAMPLNASMHLGGAALAPATVTVTGKNQTWTATSDASWISLSNATGTGNGTFVLTYNPNNLSVGQYTATVTVTASDGQVSTLPVMLTILGNAFVTDNSSASFNAINGTPIPSRSIKFSLDSGIVDNWSATTDAPWLSATPTSGVTPSLVTLTANPSTGKLSSGSYSANAQLSSPLSTPRNIPVQLQLTKPTLTLSTNSVTLGGTYGRDFTSPQQLTLSLNTLTNAWPWTLSQLPAWSSASATSGTVNQTGTSVNFTPSTASIPIGTTTVMINAEVAVNGDTLSTPVALTINKDQRKVLASETAVALVSTPTWSRLTRTLTV
ncbi:MAG: BACON domain-containing protein, partial [Glaciimonas sp.]|nr:BACON domain-containing protein [Glaciimonas sp.]